MNKVMAIFHGEEYVENVAHFSMDCFFYHIHRSQFVKFLFEFLNHENKEYDIVLEIIIMLFTN